MASYLGFPFGDPAYIYYNSTQLGTAPYNMQVTTSVHVMSNL